jgi:glycosyltransferase involved in cell wall biosynthesis
MKNVPSVIVINTASNAANHLAAALAEANLLSQFIRPYANLGRGWERLVARLPAFGNAYTRTLGRRMLPAPLSAKHVNEVALGSDFAMALLSRLPFSSSWYRYLRRKLVYRIWDAVAMRGAKALSDERMVVASWRCAQPVFEKARQRGIVRVLNYPLAHHTFTRHYLLEEAGREPAFAATLNSHDWPQWQIDRMEREIELADRILIGSSFVKDTFIAEGVPEHKLVVIPYGANTSLFKPPENAKKSPNRFNVLFVGQISQRKGLSYLLRAYERIQGPGTSLTLVGQMQDDGTALKPWRHLIHHIPHVPRSELASIFQQADVFVFPTLVEGMALVVVEAMASGLPVITTPNGPGDIVRDGVEGFIVPPRDIDAIVKRLEELRENPELRATMSANARARSQEFTWTNYRHAAINKISHWLDE